MVLTEEQVKELKKQLSEQIKDMPVDKRAEAQAQIDSMSSEALETMLKQQQAGQGGGGKNIFRMIVDGEADSIKVGESGDAVAVLDINPISRGHVMVIPKKAVKTPEEVSKGVFALAEEVSKKITDSLKAKSVRAETTTQFGEAIVHLIPIYDKDLDLNSPRSKASPEELQEVKKSLEIIKVEKKVEKIKIKKKRGRKPKPLKLKRRVP